MAEARNLKLIASLRCSEYQTGATCFIDSAVPSGRRRLVVHCDNGGYAGASRVHRQHRRRFE